MVEGICITCGKKAIIGEKGACKACYIKVFVREWYRKHPDKYEAHKAKMRDYMRAKYVSDSLKSKLQKELDILSKTMLARFSILTEDGIFVQQKIGEMEERLGLRK
jgi:DNA-directed RNA polymerase subunit RPC12/RpoP